MYLAWFDGDRKKPAEKKIAEGVRRYLEKFGGKQPTVCLCNPADYTESALIDVQPRKNIGRHCFWIGTDD